MVVPIETLIAESDRFILEEARKRKYGEISVTITMHEGVPVKLETAFCEHVAKRTATRYVVKK